MLKVIFISFCLLVSKVTNAIDATMPSNPNAGNMFGAYTILMNWVLNFVANDVAFFVAVLASVGAFVVYKLNPTSGMLKTILDWGFFIVGIFWVVTIVTFVHAQFQ